MNTSSGNTAFVDAVRAASRLLGCALPERAVALIPKPESTGVKLIDLSAARIDPKDIRVMSEVEVPKALSSFRAGSGGEHLVFMHESLDRPGTCASRWVLWDFETGRPRDFAGEVAESEYVHLITD